MPYAVTEGNFVAHYALGHALAADGRMSVSGRRNTPSDPAPSSPRRPSTMGRGTPSRRRAGWRKRPPASESARSRRDPRYADAHNNLGVVLARQGNGAEARRAPTRTRSATGRATPAPSWNLARLEAAEGRAG